MVKIIDLRMDFPPDPEDLVPLLSRIILDKEGQGIANYRRIFGPKHAAVLGTSFEALESKSRELSPEEFNNFLFAIVKEFSMNMSEFENELDEAGIVWGTTETSDNNKTAELVSKMPQRVAGMAFVNPYPVMDAVREVERAVKQLGFRCVYLSSFRSGVKADDPKHYPIYAKAVELKVPVMIYSTMNYSTELPMDIAKPIYLDRVAMDFPELKIIASCGGWPWVNEIVGLARRHRNIYIDTSIHRPKYLATPGSGWEMLMQFANSLLQDQMVFGSGSRDMGMPIKDIVKEFKELPLKEKVKEKWLYWNAARLFNLG